MTKKVLKNACIECGGDIVVEWTGEMAKFAALACDICPSCYESAQHRVQSDGGEVLPPHNHIYVDGYCACGHAVERHRR